MAGPGTEPARRPLVFVRFRLLILGGFLIVVGAAFSLVVGTVERAASADIEAGVLAELDVTRAAFDLVVERRSRELSTAIRLLGSDYAVKQALATRDPRTVGSNALSLRARVGSDVLWILDKKGRVFAEAGGGASPGVSLANLAVVREALDEDRPAASIELVGGAPYQLGAAGVRSASDDAALLLAGFRFDDAAAKEFKRITGSEVSFAVGARVFASTLAPELRRELETRLADVSAAGVSSVLLGGERQLIVAAPAGRRATAYLQQPLSPRLEPLRRLARLLVLLSLGGLALVAAFGWLLTSYLTRSIERLVEDLKQLNRFQQQFFSMVCHDATSPLMTSLGYAELIDKEAKEPETRSHARGLSRALDSLHALLSDLVDFAAIEAGKLRIERTSIDPNEVLEDVRSTSGPAAEKKGLRFDVSAAAGLPKVQADRRRLAQALQNLCGNAVHYTPRGGTVTLSASAEDGGVRFRVADTGIGIAPKDLPKIFRRFFQAENAVKHRGAGFGLGLKIAREIVEAHGGRIEVESRLGRGSTFSFRV